MTRIMVLNIIRKQIDLAQSILLYYTPITPAAFEREFIIFG
jgi:hypothetical protein